MLLQARITVYSKTGCPFCDQAKAWLLQRIPERFLEFVLVDNEGERAALYDRMALQGAERTVPQIIVWDVLSAEEEVPYRVGGYDKLIACGIESLFVESANEPRFHPNQAATERQEPAAPGV